MRRKIIMFGIVILLLSSVGMSITTVSIYGKGNTAISRQVNLLYTSHSKIKIIGNDNFTTANGVVGGNGTKDDPYIISGWDILAGDYYGPSDIYIENTTAYFIIENCSLHYADNSVYLYNVSNGIIRDNYIYNHSNILISYSTNIVIRDNNITEPSGAYPTKIKIVYSSYVKIYNNTMIGERGAGGIIVNGNLTTFITLNITTNNTVDGRPVYYYHNANMHNTTVTVSAGEIIVGNVSYLKIENSTVGSGSYYGIIVGYSSHVSILNSSVGANQGRTIDIYNSDNLMLSNLTLSGEYYGIYTNFCNNSYFSNITFYTGGVRYYRGIYMINSSRNVVYNNHISETSMYAIYMENSTLNTVLHNYIKVWDRYSIYMTKSANQNIIKNNTIYGYFDGIRLISSNGNIIENNNITGSNVVHLINSSNNKIIADIIHEGSRGITLESESNNNIIMNCTLYNNSWGDINISYSAGNILYGNDMHYGGSEYTGITLWGDISTYATQNISSNNTVNGKNVYYYKNANMNNASVPDGAGEVILGNVSFLNISNVSTDHLISSVIIGYSSHINVNNASIYNGYEGIRFYHSSNCTLLNNTVEHNNWIGVYILYSKHILLQNNTMDHSGNPWEAVILLKYSSYVIVDNNTLDRDYYEGIWVQSSNNIDIINNTVSNIYSVHETGYQGVYIQNSQGIIVSGNNMYKNYDSIIVYNSSYTELTGNIVHNNTDKGIIVQSSQGSYNIKIDNNVLYGNPAGVYIDGSSSIYIYNNSVYNNKNGIYIHRSNESIIKNNRIHNNTKNGILLGSSLQNRIYNNTVYGNERGIQLTDSSANNTVFENDIYGNTKGVYIYYNSNNNTILKNKFDNNSLGAIWIHNSTNNNLYKNFMHYDDIILYGDIKTFTTQNIPVNNTVNGKPVYYYWDKDMKNTTAPMNAGEIILGNVINFIIDNLTLGPANVGVLIGYSSNIWVISTEFTGNSLSGIYIFRSFNNNVMMDELQNNNYGVLIEYCNSTNYIEKNNFTNNTRGIYLYYSNNQTIEYNNFISNKFGIYLDHTSYRNLIIYNNLSQNKYGIQIYESIGEMPQNNNITNNTYGISFYKANQNIIFDDNICNNTYGIYSFASNGNVIKYNEIFGNSNGIYLLSSEKYNIFDNDISESACGIFLNSSKYNNIFNNYILQNNCGVNITNYADENRVEYNTIENVSYGVCLSQYSYYNEIGNNTINNGAYGIYFEKTYYLTIYNNTIYGEVDGIYGKQSTITSGGTYGVRISKNRIYESNTGIGLSHIYRSYIFDNDIHDNNNIGIHVNAGTYDEIANNKVHNNKGDGIYLTGYTYVDTITENIIYSNCEYGVDIDNWVVRNKIYDNFFYYNHGSGDKYDTSHVQAQDYGIDTYWNDSDDGPGNYWYDWANNNNTNDQNNDGFVDWPYKIDGKHADNQPLKTSSVSMPSLVPSAPRKLSAIGENNYVHLSWEKPLGQGSSNITAYRVYRDGLFIAIVSPNQTWFNDTQVTPGVTYSYYVTAVNDVGESCPSNEVQATPSGSIAEFSEPIWILIIVLIIISMGVFRHHEFT